MTLGLRRFRRSSARRFYCLATSFLYCLAVITLALLCFDSSADANGVDVDGFLQDFESQRGKINTYAAQFVQTKTLPLFDETKISTGEVLYKTPQQMIWKYDTPDKTQMRMDPVSVSFYFPELKQIEKYSLKKSGGASHLFFAFEASAEELKESFEVALGATNDEALSRIELKPKSDQSAPQLRSITLWVGKSDYLPRKILIHETSGDTTKIELSKVRVNEPMADSELKFNAPEGTKIIDADQGEF